MIRLPQAPCYVHDIVTAVPDKWLEHAAGPGLLKQACTSPRNARLMERILRLTGIERRYLAALDYQPPGREDEWLYKPAGMQPGGPGMTARTAAFRKSADPLLLGALAQLPREFLAGVGVLVTATCTHAGSPGLEEPILAHTPVPPDVDRWNLGFMGCSAGLACMRLVHQAADLQRRALIVACELSSLHFQFTEQLDQMTANLLFADGLAAMTMSPEPSPVRILACRCVSLPQFASQMIWFAGDHGLQLELSQELPDTLAAHLPAAVSRFLADCELDMGAVDHWMVHPGGPQILDAVEASLQLPPHALNLSRLILKKYGNMSSPTIIFIMKELFASGVGGKAVAMAFGPGLTIELVLLDLVC